MSHFVLSGFGDEIAESLNTQMDVMEKLGIRYIEMRGVNGRPLVQHTLEEVKAIKSILDQHGFKISCLGSPVGKIKITDPFEPHLELFQHTLKIAKILETKYIRVFSFFIPKGEKPEDYRQEVLKRWLKLVELARGTGITLLHENEKDIYGDTPERCLELLKAAEQEQVRAIFDPANFVQCDVETYPHAFELLKDYVAYMHIKDAMKSDHRVVPAGQGDGKVSEILKELDQRGFEGFLSLEPHLGDFKGFAELEEVKDAEKLPEGGPRTFALAVDSLRKILPR